MRIGKRVQYVKAGSALNPRSDHHQTVLILIAETLRKEKTISVKLSDIYEF